LGIIIDENGEMEVDDTPLTLKEQDIIYSQRVINEHYLQREKFL